MSVLYLSLSGLLFGSLAMFGFVDLVGNCFLQIDFVKPATEAVKKVIRLVKFWKKVSIISGLSSRIPRIHSPSVFYCLLFKLFSLSLFSFSFASYEHTNELIGAPNM